MLKANYLGDMRVPPHSMAIVFSGPKPPIYQKVQTCDQTFFFSFLPASKPSGPS